MSTSTDVIIIGGGVLGVSLAYHLSKRKINCVVLEMEQILGSQASGKNAGMIRQLYRHPKLTSWAMHSIESWQKNNKDDFCNDMCSKTVFKQTGSYIVGRTSPNHHNHLFTDTTLFGAPTVLTQTDGLLDSGLYLNTLEKHCDRKYVKFYLRTKVIHVENNNTWNITTNNPSEKNLSSKWLVNASGAWAGNTLSPFLNISKSSIEPFARHLAVVSGWEDTKLLDQQNKENITNSADNGFIWDEISEWYMRPWDLSAKLVSVCDQTPACPETFTPNPFILTEIANKLITAFPTQSTKLSITKSWHCFRTYTLDKLPVWGESQSIPYLFWLAGFGGFGMSTSFAATKDAALYIAGKTMANDTLVDDFKQKLSDFSPDRILPSL